MREIKFEYISEFERFNHEKDDFEKYFVKQVLTLQDIENKIFSHTKTLIAKRQYTGLKGKNGVEIYEGDVVVHDEQLSYEVKYRDFVGAYWLNDFRYSGGFWIDEVNWGYVEVIGNIYENSELLS